MAISVVTGPPCRAAQAADWALSHGVAAMTTAQVSDLLQIPVEQVPQRLSVPKRRGEWVSPARGLWVPVAPEFRGWGGPPATEIIDAVMAHLDVTYYIGWLAAAALHGAAHQAPQVTHVAVSRMVRQRLVGRAHLVFHERRQIDRLPMIDRMARSGTFKVSTPEVTALDVATDIVIAGGLDNAATVIADLADETGLDDEVLAAAGLVFPDSAIRRVGWIVETFTNHRLDRAAEQVSRSSVAATRLHPAMPLTGGLSDRWRLRLNTKVDLE